VSAAAVFNVDVEVPAVGYKFVDPESATNVVFVLMLVLGVVVIRFSMY